MMWGNGFSMGWWGWPVGLLILVGVILLVFVAVRAFGGSVNRGGSETDSSQSGPSRAHQILDERFAKGELNAEEYNEQLKVLGAKP